VLNQFDYHVAQKNVHWVFFYNLKKLKPKFVTLTHDILIFLASTHMQDFQPDLSRVATLPKYINRIGTLLSSGCMALKR